MTPPDPQGAETRCDECGESIVGKKAYKIMRGNKDSGLRMCAECRNWLIRNDHWGKR